MAGWLKNYLLLFNPLIMDVAHEEWAHCNTGWLRLPCKDLNLDIGVKATCIIWIGWGWPGKGSVRIIQVGQDWPLGIMTQILGWRPPISYGLAGGDLEREVSVQYRLANIGVCRYYDSDIGVKATHIIQIGQYWHIGCYGSVEYLYVWYSNRSIN